MDVEISPYPLELSWGWNEEWWMKHLSPAQSKGPVQISIDYYDLKMAPKGRYFDLHFTEEEPKEHKGGQFV